MSSLEKRRKEDRFGSQLTGTLSETVNSSNFVNNLLTEINNNTLNKQSNNNNKKSIKFSQELQRISSEHRLKAEKVAENYGRKSFNEVLDVYSFCFDFCEDLSKRLGVSLSRLPNEIEKFLPRDEIALLGYRLSEFLEEIRLDKHIRRELEGLLYSILFTAKIQKDRKKIEEFKRVLALLEGGKRDETS